MNTRHEQFHKRPPCFRRLGCVTLLLAFVTRLICGDTLVLPQDAATSPAPGSQLPFAGEMGRYQNIYNASHFTAAIPAGGFITAIAFRIDESDRSSFSTAIPDLEIRMSTSTSIAPNISAAFEQNTGPDETVVFARGSLSVSVKGNPNGVNPFDLRISLQRPFFYDPRKGSLAVDLFNFQEPGHRLLIDSEGPGMIALHGPIGSTETIPIGALIIQLEVTPVPEPSNLTLVILGIAGFILRRKVRGA